MDKEITFPDYPKPDWDFERDCVWFPAVVDGSSVGCLVSAELLMQKFGAQGWSESELLSAYEQNKQDIQNLARAHIETGWIDEEKRVLLTTRYTRLSVIMRGRIAENAQVAAAQRMLAEIIGPNAGVVTVEWKSIEDSPGIPYYHITITDPSLARPVSATVSQTLLGDPTTVRVTLAGLWSTLLRARSQNLFLKSG